MLYLIRGQVERVINFVVVVSTSFCPLFLSFYLSTFFSFSSSSSFPFSFSSFSFSLASASASTFPSSSPLSVSPFLHYPSINSYLTEIRTPKTAKYHLITLGYIDPWWVVFPPFLPKANKQISRRQPRIIFSPPL